ncbi:MAG: fructose-6-phosphate aldolase [Actinomycetota bacterium]|nr:fructose-6-phosphate aldolase [Actinomycetota bacterium]MDI6821888.1 fructose-6-phosphate aldolase [Actinomycetota bacterium]
MKIFIDTANIEHIREVNSWGILSGVTTNPSLCAREGKEFRSSIKEICEIVDGPVSAEAVSMEREGIVKEARELARIAENVVVKIPMMTEGLAATRVLANEGVKVNMTLIFSVNQALLAAQVGATYISPFIGRLDDIGQDGMGVLSDIVLVYDNYGIETQVIAASIRHPMHVVRAAQIGVDIATVPYEVLKAMIKHPLTDKGIAKFLEDWEKLKKSVHRY